MFSIGRYKEDNNTYRSLSTNSASPQPTSANHKQPNYASAFHRAILNLTTSTSANSTLSLVRTFTSPPPHSTVNPHKQCEERHVDLLRALHNPILSWFSGLGSALLAVRMVYLEMKYPVRSHVYFARSRGDAGERDGREGGRRLGVRCSASLKMVRVAR